MPSKLSEKKILNLKFIQHINVKKSIIIIIIILD